VKEDEESAPRSTSGADKKGKRKKKRPSHIHIGPNVRAFRAGLAFCPACDEAKILRLTEQERESERAAKEAGKAAVLEKRKNY
jgi:hypothetical protein